ncbi:MAG: cytochrome c3 family protein [Bacteroidales bacterium]|nr:cytochrome c3 family protein [Bacteroidales bacterium]
MQNKLLIIFIASLFIWVNLPASSLVNMEDEPANLEGNKLCFDCHANKIYSYENEMTGRIDRKAMNPNFIYNPDDFYKGVHRHFSCTDCHSPDYEIFPHQAELRLEEMYSCMDCHGGDPTYAQYQFDLINDEFHKSVHSSRHDESFNCWMCHDPHSYRSMTRSNFKVSEIVTYHNNVCASCHDNPDHFQRISDSLKRPLDQIHAFLPNYKLHFSAVRCIECHTSVQDTMWVAHNILSKDLAVKKCVECHSANTMLMSSLYKYQNIEARRNRGTLNAVFLNESYVIGANRNVYLNILSLVLFGMTIIGILIHIFFRIKSK